MAYFNYVSICSDVADDANFVIAFNDGCWFFNQTSHFWLFGGVDVSAKNSDATAF